MPNLAEKSIFRAAGTSPAAAGTLLYFLLAFLPAPLPAAQTEPTAPAAKGQNLLAILATVDGEPITLYDVLLDTRRAEQQLAATEPPDQLPAAVRRLRRQAVEKLIDRRLLYTEFKARSYRVPEQLVEDLLDQLAIDYAGGNREELAKRAAADGTTMPELRVKAHERVAVDLLLHEVCHRPVYITPAQVRDHYDRHPAEFTEPGRLSLQVLLLRKDAALASRPADFPARLADELAGADEARFATMVKLHSDDPRRESGGLTGWTDESGLRPEFAAALKGAVPGAVVGPVVLPEGICFLRLKERQPPRALPFAEVKERIREALEKADRERRYQELAAKLRARAVIRTFFEKE